MRTFNNIGEFNKSVGAGVTFISVNFENTSPLNVLTGTLNMNVASTGTGAHNVSPGATLQYGGGTHTLDASSSVLGAGTVHFSSATVTINGIYNITNDTQFTGGNVTFTPASTLTSLSSGPLAVSGGSVTFNSGETPILVTTPDPVGG